jgi:phenylacetate-CoA ligase
VERIDGRIESYIVTPDGRYLGRLDFLFKNTDAIEEAQLYQDALDHLTVRIVRSPHYADQHEKALMRDLRRYLGNEIRIDLEYLSEIPREANGKFRQIVSKVFLDRHADATDNEARA